MKISYDTEINALSIIFQETTVTTEHLAEGITAEYDSEGQLAGIEILDAVQRLGERETFRQVIIQEIGLLPLMRTITRPKAYPESSKDQERSIGVRTLQA